MTNKTCSECRRDRPLARFVSCKHAPDGRLDRCLDCICAAAQRGRLEREQLRTAHPASTSFTENSHARSA